MINLTLLITLICFGVYVWGVRAVFRITDNGEPLKFKLTKIFSLFSMLLFLHGISIANPVLPMLQILAILFQCVSLLLFHTANKANQDRILSLAFSSDVPTRLLKSGPYSYIRHPFYTSYILGYFGATIGTQNFYYAFLFTPLFLIYFLAAQQEEKKFIGSKLANQYKSYCQEAGMFFPNIKRLLKL